MAQNTFFQGACYTWSFLHPEVDLCGCNSKQHCDQHPSTPESGEDPLVVAKLFTVYFSYNSVFIVILMI